MSNYRIEKLSDTNYASWKAELRAVLIEKGYWKAVHDPTNLTDAQKADGIDEKAQACILLNVGKTKQYLIREAATAKDAWEAIATAYTFQSHARINELKGQLDRIEMRRAETMTDYFARGERLREEVAMAGSEVSLEDYKRQMINGLPSAYGYIVELELSNWIADGTKKIADILGRLQQTESRLLRETKRGGMAAYAGAETPQETRPPPRRETRTCFNCGKAGHVMKDCRAPPRKQERCGYCAKQGHREDECRAKKNAQAARAHFAQANVALAGKYTSGNYDPSDYMLYPEIYESLNAECGPFDIDGAADERGSNAQGGLEHCYKGAGDFTKTDVSGMNVWLNPPFNQAKRFLSHYLDCKKKDPMLTSGVFILPYKPNANWWGLTRGMLEVRRWDKGSQLFTMPGKEPPGIRREVEPYHFPVVALWDPPAAPAAKALMAECIVLDSGASHHMTPNKKLLLDYKPCGRLDPDYVRTADGNMLEVGGVGKLHLPAVYDTKYGRQSHEMVLPGVLHIPGLERTLLSLPTMAKDGATVELDKSGVCITVSGERGAAMLKGTLEGNLYTLDYTPAASGEANVAVYRKDAELWHRRMGHLGYHSLSKLPTMAEGIDAPRDEFILKAKDGGVCAECMAGRQTREPRPEGGSARATVPLHRLHVDLCGPMPETSYQGHAYYLLVVDEATRYSSLVTIPSKGHAAEELLTIINTLERTTEHKVKYIRSDRGGEFVTLDLDAEWRERGIITELTAAYSPESNGLSERGNRTIMDKARSMLADAQLPEMFWADAVGQANYLRNRSPVSGSKLTPYELLYGRTPDLSRMRVFGCMAHVHIPKDLRTKLDKKSEPGVLVGVDLEAKQYRVWIDGRSKSYRDVVCDETVAAWPRLYADNDVDHYVGATTHQDPDWAPDPPESGEDETSGDRSCSEAAGDVTEPAAGGGRYPARSRAPPAQYGEFYSHLVAAAPEGVAVGKIIEPRTVAEAMGTPQAKMWQHAMQEEMDALMSNGTWELDKTPAGVSPLPCKWVFKIKYNQDGSIERFKARLVVGGHRQRDGIDYDEVFAPVSKYATVRALLSITAIEDFELHAIDVSNAFLNGTLDTPVYMRQPETYDTGDTTVSCKLTKTLYGLKQSPREWFIVLSKELHNLGFKPSKSDQALWIGTASGGPVYLVHWVDDLLIATKTTEDMRGIKAAILSKFKGRDLGEAVAYLNLKIERDRDNRTLKFWQPAHIETVLTKFNMLEAKTKPIPMAPDADYTSTDDRDEKLPSPTPYQECVGALMYISSVSRPDLCTSVNILARSMSNPSERHWRLLKELLRYLAGSKELAITYGGTTAAELEAWTDADWAACKDSRRSRGGYVFTLNGGAISWSSKLQSVVATSTAESEYIAAALAAREAVWLLRLTSELGVQSTTALALKVDNQAAIHMARNGADTPRTKHVAVHYHFIKDMVAVGSIRLVHCNTNDNAADLFTKPLNATKLKHFTSMIGMG
jgi:hypothetical protein